MTIKRFGIEFSLKPDQIYLDSATIGKMPVSSIEKITEYYTNLGSAPVRGMNNETVASNKLLQENRKSLSQIFGIDSKRISFFASRENAITNALFSLINLSEKRFITSILEEHSIIAPAIKVSSFFKSKIEYLNLIDEVSIVDKLNEIVTSSDIVFLSSLTSTNGIKRDWKKIAEICEENKATFIMDMSSSIGHEELKFAEKSPDIVISSGCIGALGPMGSAFMITSDEIYETMEPLTVGNNSVIALEETFYLLNSSGSKFETGIVNGANISAMTNSLEILSKIGLTKIQEHEEKLNQKLRNDLKTIHQIEVNELEKAQYGSIVSFGSDKIESHDLAMALEDIANVQVRSGALCSHLFMYELKFNDIIRVSTHAYNTLEEIDIFIDTLKSLFEQIE